MTLPVRSPSSAAWRRRCRSPVASCHGALCALALVLGQERPGQGDVLELAQVAEVVLNGQALLTRPAEGVIQPPLRDPHPCPQRRDRTHVGREVTHVQALRLVEQVERAVQISFSLPDPSHRDAPAIAVLRQPGVLAQLLARQQVLRGGSQVVTLAVERAHPYVHVCRSPQNRPALLRCKLQRLLVGAHRLAETTLRNPDVRQRDRTTEDVGDVPRPLQTRHAVGVRSGALPRGPRSPRPRAPAARRPRHARDGRPHRRGRAPAGRRSWCRPHRPGASACAAR